MIHEICVQLPNLERHVHSICQSKLFSVQEDILTCSLLDSTSEKISILWERICGITLKNSKSINDFNHLEILLIAMRQNLTQLSFLEYQGHPPYWVQVLKTYLTYRFTSEALEVGKEWKTWMEPTQSSGQRVDGDLWFLSIFSLFELSVGDIVQGLADLKKAYALQEDIWKRFPNYVNDFAYFIQSATNDLPEMKNKLSHLSISQFNDQTISDLFK